MTELRRELGLFHVTMYGIGLILGAGIYVLIGEAANLAGSALWASFVVGAVIATLTGLSYAELSSMYPKAAAEYVYTKNAFDNNFLSFITGWLVVFTAIVSAATISMGFAGYLAELYGLPVSVSAILLIIILSFVNFYGIKESSWMNVAFTLIEAAGLAFIVLLGFVFGRTDQVNYLESPSGIAGILSAVPLVIFAYIGFENIANIAEETKNPKSALPRAFVLSIAITALFYILVSIAAVSALDWKALGESKAPLADVAGAAIGQIGYQTLSIIALFATTNTVLIALISGSRMLYGIAEQGSLPKLLSSIHSGRRTPWLSIVAIMLVSIIFVFLGNIVTVAHVTVFSVIVTYAFVNLSVIRLRYKYPSGERSFRVPLAIGKFPILPFLGFVTSLIGVTQFNSYVLSIGTGVIALGAILYILYARFGKGSIHSS
jgi:APA family basic amino acid/polyamine antiporter